MSDPDKDTAGNFGEDGLKSSGQEDADLKQPMLLSGDQNAPSSSDQSKYQTSAALQGIVSQGPYQKQNLKDHKEIVASRAAGMDPRRSFGVYPRFDQLFKKKRSLNFDMMKSEIFVNRQKQNEVWQWLAYLIIGIIIGVIAFGMAVFEEWLVERRIVLAQSVLKSNSQTLAWATLASWCFSFAAVGSAMTIYLGPGANGSGIADLMIYINGINYTGFIGWGTLGIKIVCVVMGIAGALCIGKEGPLAHIGAVVAVGVIYKIPLTQFKEFQNDVHKREFACAGISAGVSAAFASPIGGALFSYELSSPSTFWTFGMIWKTFFCSSVSTFTLSILNQIQKEGFDNLLINSAGTIKFGSLQDIEIPVKMVFGSLFLGVMGGMLGSLFIAVNTQMGYCRKKIIKNNCIKMVECGLYGMATITVMSIIVINFNECQAIKDCNNCSGGIDDASIKIQKAYDDEVDSFIVWNCPDKYFSPLATLFFNTEGGVIRTLFKYSEYFDIRASDLALFGSVWYFFTIVTYGVFIPAGLFLPGIIMGGAMGRLWAYFIQYLFAYTDGSEIEQNTILGSAAMLAGYCRLTYSLTVIMLETTQAVNLFIPMMLNMLASYFTAKLFNQSLYIRAIRGKQCPYLLDEIPEVNKNIRAQIIMRTPYTLPLVPLVSEIEEALKKGYRVFPLLNKCGQLVGQIPANFLCILLEKEHFYTGQMNEEIYNGRVSDNTSASYTITDDKSGNLSAITEDREIFVMADSKARKPNNINFSTQRSDASLYSRGGSVRSQITSQFAPDYKVGQGLGKQDTEEQLKMQMQKSIQNMLEKKRTYLNLTVDQKRAISELEQLAMRDLCRYERRGSETDLNEIPESDCLTTPILDWSVFNTDFLSSERTYDEVAMFCVDNRDQRIDLRPYMIFQPNVCFSTDRIQKTLNIFRFMQIRQLCVVNPTNGQLSGVISRQDLFEYMSL